MALAQFLHAGPSKFWSIEASVGPSPEAAGFCPLKFPNHLRRRPTRRVRLQEHYSHRAIRCRQRRVAWAGGRRRPLRRRRRASCGARTRGGFQTPDGEAFLEYRVPSPAVMDMVHTYVPRSKRGQGLAARLCDAAFAHARGRGMRVVPTCSYISVRDPLSSSSATLPTGSSLASRSRFYCPSDSPKRIDE